MVNAPLRPPRERLGLKVPFHGLFTIDPVALADDPTQSGCTDGEFAYAEPWSAFLLHAMQSQQVLFTDVFLCLYSIVYTIHEIHGCVSECVSA